MPTAPAMSADVSGGMLDRPVAMISANREKALLSHLWNKCRKWGFTDAENPCKGVRGYGEAGRDMYVEDDVYRAVWDAADQPLRDALDLAYQTGQRPSDALNMDRRDVRDGFLHVSQGKTRHKLRIAIERELAELLVRFSARTFKRRGKQKGRGHCAHGAAAGRIRPGPQQGSAAEPV